MMRHIVIGATLLASLPMLLAGSNAAMATDFVYVGTFIVPVEIALVTTAPGQIWCHVRVSSVQDSALYEDVNIQATEKSAGVFACVMEAPFEWNYGTFSSTPNLEVTATINVYLANTTNTNPTFAALNLTRNSEHFAPTTANVTVQHGNVAFPWTYVRL